MNSTDFPERTPKSRGFNKKLLIYVFLLIAGISAAVALAFKFGLIPDDTNPEETEPPPIIIKSGSFIIETEGDFDSISPGNNPPFVFRKNNFKVRNIRVFSYNERTGRAYDPQYFQNEEVRIWFQNFDFNTNKWQDLAPGALPDIVIAKGTTDFVLTKNSGKKLKPTKKSSKKRQTKLEDEEHPNIFRFGRIEIGNSLPIIPSQDYDEYFISFYKVP